MERIRENVPNRQEEAIGLLVAERRAQIAKQVEAKGSVRVSELSAYFGVTEETIRRDLEELERQQILKRTYGGAVKWSGTGYELPYAKRRAKNAKEKAKIAQAAVALLSEGDTISLDASTTVLAMCQQMHHVGRLTVLTNSIQVMIELAGRSGIHVIGTGGSVRETALSFVGPLAERAIADHHVDKAFISCKGLHPEVGITDSNELEVELKKKMAESARRLIVLADHTKFGYIAFARIASLQAIDTIITDDGADPADVRLIEEAGVKVIVAGSESASTSAQ